MLKNLSFHRITGRVCHGPGARPALAGDRRSPARSASRLIVFLAFVSLVGPLRAAEPLRLPERPGHFDPGGHLDVFEDRDGRLDYAALRQLASGWRPHPGSTANFTFSESTYWLRLPVTNPGPQERRLLLEIAHPLPDLIDVYFESAAGPRHFRAGDRRPQSLRPIRHRHHLFPLDLPAGATTTLYLRLGAWDGMHEPAPLVLWDRDEFYYSDGIRTLVLGLLLGTIAIMAVYNLFVFFALGDASFLYFVAMISCGLLFLLAYYGYLGLYLWPEYPHWANRFHPIVLSLLFALMSLFARSYLKINQGMPDWNRYLNIQAAALAALGALTLVLPFWLGLQLIAAAGIVVLLSLATLGFIALRRKSRPAKYFLFAFSGLILGGLFMILRAQGLIPATLPVENVGLSGLVLAVVVISLGLADRINEFRQESRQSREWALEIEQLANAELAENYEKLKRLDRLKSDFLANTSHELRTPLNGIIGLTESLLRGAGGKLPESARENLRLIAASGRRLSTLVNDVLDFAKLQHGDFELNRRPVDLETVVDLVLALSRPMLAGKDLELVHRRSKTPYLDADENRLEQILFNLIGNAIKFTRSGTVEIDARSLPASAAHPQGLVEITVHDTGIGIPPEKQDMIFESFTQADGSISRQYSGTGLGLSITRKLVELHGGEIRVESVPGEGSRFIFTMPAAPADAEIEEEVREISPLLASEDEEGGLYHPAATSGWNAPAANLHGGGPPPRTLIVDDDPVNLQVLRNHLALLEHDVTAAVNGREALELLERDQGFDLVLLDVMMPGLSGYEVCRIIRESASSSELPVVLLTAKNRISDLVLGLESGANDYLVKPFDPRELTVRVETMINLKRAARSQSELSAITMELSLARDLQQALLPRKLPEVAGLGVAARYRSMEKVGGDYYDLMERDGALGVLMADVSGHGVPAALIVSIVKIAFWFQRDFLDRPDILFQGMNEALLGNIGNEFVTACFAFVDPARRKLITCNGGHLPLLIWKRARSELVQLKPHGRVLGLLQNGEYGVEELELERGDRILLYTDGILEAADRDGTIWWEERFHRFIAERNELGPNEFAEELVRTVTDWSGGDHRVEDDIAVVVVDVE